VKRAYELLTCFAAVGVGALLAAAPAGAGGLETAAAEDVVQVVTHDEDGSSRETKVWIVWVDGEAYLRTHGTRWGANLERDPQAVLRAAGTEQTVRVERVEDPARIDAVVAAFRTKYGFSDRLAGLVRFGARRIFHLVPRAG
jgi:hypothetical protein